MNTRYFVLLGLLLATINCQNGCAIGQLGVNRPTKLSDCSQDTSVPAAQCCLVMTKVSATNFLNLCFRVPDSVTVDSVRDGLDQANGQINIITCSAASISISMMLFALLALFLF